MATDTFAALFAPILAPAPVPAGAGCEVTRVAPEVVAQVCTPSDLPNVVVEQRLWAGQVFWTQVRSSSPTACHALWTATNKEFGRGPPFASTPDTTTGRPVWNAGPVPLGWQFDGAVCAQTKAVDFFVAKEVIAERLSSDQSSPESQVLTGRDWAVVATRDGAPSCMGVVDCGSAARTLDAMRTQVAACVTADGEPIPPSLEVRIVRRTTGAVTVTLKPSRHAKTSACVGDAAIAAGFVWDSDSPLSAIDQAYSLEVAATSGP